MNKNPSDGIGGMVVGGQSWCERCKMYHGSEISCEDLQRTFDRPPIGKRAKLVAPEELTVKEKVKRYDAIIGVVREIIAVSAVSDQDIADEAMAMTCVTAFQRIMMIAEIEG